MLSNFTNDEFEKFLKKNSDGLRLHPAEKVWKNIYHKLNERRRRIGFATGAFFLITSLLGYFVVQNKEGIKPLTPLPSEVNNSSEYSNSTANNTFIDKAAIKNTGENDLIAEDLALTQQPKNQKQIAIIRQLYTGAARERKIQEEKIAHLTGEEKPFSMTVTDDTYPLPASAKSNEKSIAKINEESDKLLTIESVTNAYKFISKKKKASFQFFFTPTISYRKLTENKTYMRSVPQNSVGINYAVLYNVNQAVTHKPDMGLELGFAAKYPIAKNLKLKGGLQFNMSRYDIKAFDYPTEYATIALNNSNGVGYTGSRSNYRNFGATGVNEDWLQNMYFQLSAPVGAEIRLGGNKNTSFGVASTIQPTYVISDRAYLISTDYKNYSEVPWLMRRWNVATSVETFVSYSTGKMNWQVGPQVRYQLLSSFVAEYPVKENLFDFGLKVGVSLNNDKKSSDNK
jgi:hypothetical protein